MKAKFNPLTVDAGDLVGRVIIVSNGQIIVRARVISCNGELDGTLFLVEHGRYQASAGKFTQQDIFSCKKSHVLEVED